MNDEEQKKKWETALGQYEYRKFMFRAEWMELCAAAIESLELKRKLNALQAENECLKKTLRTISIGIGSEHAATMALNALNPKSK